jgi:hypothetical protein
MHACTPTHTYISCRDINTESNAVKVNLCIILSKMYGPELVSVKKSTSVSLRTSVKCYTIGGATALLYLSQEKLKIKWPSLCQ